MADDGRRSDASAVTRYGSVSVERSSSRLLRRGLASLDADQKVCLNIEDLIASGDSLFVLSGDWIRLVRCEGLKQTSQASAHCLSAYEFSPSGEFRAKIKLNLACLAPSVTAHVEKVEVRSGFIHIREQIRSRDAVGRPAFTLLGRLHYVFDRSGSLLCAWGPAEVLAVIDRSYIGNVSLTDFDPIVVTDEHFFEFGFPESSSHIFQNGLTDVQFEESRSVIANANVFRVRDAPVAALCVALAGTRDAAFMGRTYPLHPAQSVVREAHFRFPLNIGFRRATGYTYEVLEPWYFAQWPEDRFSDTCRRASWFLYSQTGDYSVFDTLWSLKAGVNEPQVEAYPIDLLLDLLRASTGDDSSSAHYQTDPNLQYSCRSVYASDDGLLVIMQSEPVEEEESWMIDEVILLVEPKDGKLVLRRVLDRGSRFLDEQGFHDSRSIEHRAFSNGLLFSKLRSDDSSDWILVTDVRTDRASWFRPEVSMSVLGAE